MPLQRDVVRAWLRLYGAIETERLLKDYFGKSSEGQEEKQRSQHRDTPLEDFVAIIIADVLEGV